MTAYSEITIQCDVDSAACPILIRTGYTTKAKARAFAAKQGWTTIQAAGFIGDMCPDHATATSLELNERIRA